MDDSEKNGGRGCIGCHSNVPKVGKNLYGAATAKAHASVVEP